MDRLRRRGGRSRGRGAYVVVALVGLSLVLAACSNAPTVSQSTPTPTAAPAPRLRFAANWSSGLSGWQATPGWTITSGGLESNASDSLALTVPYQPPTSIYTVDIDVQVLNVPKDGGYYILDVAPTSSAAGYQAGIDNLRGPGPRPNGDHPTIRTNIVPVGDWDRTFIRAGMNDFEPGESLRTYQIRVDTDSVSLSVDGRYWVSASTTGKPLPVGPLVLQVSGAQVLIAGLRVIA